MIFMSIFSRMLDNLTNLGFFDFILPWLLFVAVFFGLLQGKKTISEDPAVNGVISIAAAFFVAYVARGIFFTQMFGFFGVVLAGFLVIVISLAMFGIKPEELLGAHKTALAVILAFIAIFVFVAAGGLDIFGVSIDSDTIMTIVLLLVLAGAVAYIGGGGK